MYIYGEIIGKYIQFIEIINGIICLIKKINTKTYFNLLKILKILFKKTLILVENIFLMDLVKMYK